MNIKTLELGPFGTNCYVVWGKANQALIIDPGNNAPDVIKLVKAKELSIAAYLMTHGHMDHIFALADIYDMIPAPIAIHPDDLTWAFADVNTMPPYYPDRPRRPTKIERSLSDGQEFTDGGLTYRIIHTPGHTPGGVCLYFESDHVLFTGDTLFAGSVGRTDFPGGSTRILTRSLASLATLPDNTIIYPGHGPDTTMAHEKRTNMFMRS